MGSDVKLEGEQVRVEAWDLVLDSADRRKSPEGDRRALVHDKGDGLTLNWGHDYPGGVRLQGVRLITKDPGFIQGVTITGGLHVAEGILQVTNGQKVVLSAPSGTGDFASGEIFQTAEGLQVAGGRTDGGTEQKAVALQKPVAKKTIKWGDWSAETRNRVGSRARPASSGTVTLLAGAALAGNRASAAPARGAILCEFDIVDTFIQVLDELSELRERVAALEAGAPG
jgi:hypothetical protein